jgi:regulator of cell morphogenesis and NO signaling
MADLLNESLAQIVKSNFRTAAVLEQYHLDFCCKGKKTLLQACREKNIASPEVVTAIEKIMETEGPRIDFEQFSLTELADYIVETHHSYVKTESSQLFTWLQKVASKHSVRHPELLEVFDLFVSLEHELMEHMQKEEVVLFPRIKDLERLEKVATPLKEISRSFITAPVAMMEQEHETAGTLMEKIRVLTNNYTAPADACTTYRISFTSLQAFEADLHQHIHLENNILFPKSIALIERLKDRAGH